MIQPVLNSHNKQEYPPMHTAEHILNQTMIRYFGCGRAFSAHIERKKSKCDYRMETPPTDEQIRAVEAKVNEVIMSHCDVTISYVAADKVPDSVDLGKLPTDVSETLRLVAVGDYDLCACIGAHVENTAEIGEFKILSHSFENGVLRLRFKVVG